MAGNKMNIIMVALLLIQTLCSSVTVYFAAEGYSEIIIKLAQIVFLVVFTVFILFVGWLVASHFDLWNRLKNKIHVFKLDRKVPDIADEFERIKNKFDKFTNKNDYGNIFGITSNISIRNEGFKDGFAIFKTLKEVFHNDIYKHFHDESTSFLNGRKNKKEDFVRLLIPLYRALYQHECIVNSFLGLVENGRYNISNDVDKEFNDFKENYNGHLDEWNTFIEMVKIKLGKREVGTWNVNKIKTDDDKSLIELSKEEV